MNPIKHVAIIMDGNGRWGLKNQKSRNFGHEAGLKTIERIINLTLIQKIPFLTIYAFSTENWKRPRYEITFLFKLLNNFLKKNLNNINKKNIKIKIIGDKEKFSKILKLNLKKTEETTKNNKKLQVNLAINYGSKKEIVDCVNKLIKKREKISEKNINKYISTRDTPDPDIMIRSGGKKRLSNFLLWQLAYSELFFIDKLWPDFSNKDYLNILSQFRKIKRNYGSI